MLFQLIRKVNFYLILETLTSMSSYENEFCITIRPSSNLFIPIACLFSYESLYPTMNVNKIQIVSGYLVQVFYRFQNYNLRSCCHISGRFASLNCEATNRILIYNKNGSICSFTSPLSSYPYLISGDNKIIVGLCKDNLNWYKLPN